MGFRFHRRVRLNKWVHLNISKSGLGFSLGKRGLRMSISPKGKKSVSVGVPGSGASCRTGCIIPMALAVMALVLACR